jgi:beta-lactamase superfamily II metal-dependent hydrolase
MTIYTLNVGQGQFVIVTSVNEALIVDSYVPLSPAQDVVNVKSALANALHGKNLVGYIATGFDADHFNEVGIKIILNKYRPKWVMYPKYFKKTTEADACFAVISQYALTNKVTKYSIKLEDNQKRLYDKLAADFQFEVFSPHSDDMTSSNNCSLVCSVIERSSAAKYLVTGDTEQDRWASIERFFGKSLETHVLAAPHHGSRNGITAAALRLIQPHTVLISAGVDNQYGHPNAETLRLLKQHSQHCYCTNTSGGQSLRTVINNGSIKTYKFTPVA